MGTSVVDEAGRLAELRAYDILDTPPEPAFDELVRLATLVTGAPAASLTFQDGDREWCKARTGDEVARVTVASVPVLVASGHTLGALAVHDAQPRDLTAVQRDALAAVGHQVVAQLELRRLLADRARMQRESSERFELLARATNDAVWDWDLVTNNIWWNEGMRTLFGYLPEDVSSIRSWTNALHPDDEARVSDSLYAVINGGKQFWSDTYRYRCQDGRWADIFDRGYVIRDAAGTPVRMIGAMIDISERRKLEEQLRQSQKMDAIGQLSGGIAHDFNNLLTVIQVNAALLARKAKERGMREHTDAIAEATERAASLTRQLLMVSRRQLMQARVIDVNDIVTNLTRMLQRVVGEHIVLVAQTGCGLPLVNADSSMLEQVLLNLVINARDAMPDGGQLTIVTGHTTVKDPQQEHGFDVSPGPYVWVSVSDTGSGIANEHLPHIFEPFFTTKDVGRGTGLGLATAYGIVRQHHGWIEVASEAEHGSRFTFYLPATTEARTERSSTSPVDESELPRGTETILVVEDERALRNLVVSVLESCGYTVLGAGSGHAALEVWNAAASRVQLLLTDIVMPGGINGRELAERLRAEAPDLPVVFTSGYSPELTSPRERRDEPLVEGVNFLQKPYEPGKLAATVRARLDQARRESP